LTKHIDIHLYKEKKMVTQTPTPTHQAVQEYYGKLAREAGPCCESSANSETGSCCGTSSSTEQIQNTLYPAELLTGIPVDVANFTAGSGDPISLAKIKPGETVLDLGSGGGLDCFLAARLVGESGRVIGVDMTPAMLERARSNAERVSSKNVEFREGFLEALPVEDNSIDAIISNCVINLSPDKPKVFREMLRTLKPGGRMAVSDMVANHPLSEEARKNKEDWCGCTTGALTDKEYNRGLSEAGFIDIRLEPNVEAVTNAIDNGQVRIPQGHSKEEMLADLHAWGKCERTMVVPHKITARKPA
jgi:arsenite methyltransferase